MSWFERLTGFEEGAYAETKALLDVEDGALRSEVNGKSYGVGTLVLPSLGELRDANRQDHGSGVLSVGLISGDVRALHGQSDNRGALFQVASQFNLLEMMGPHDTPEDGVTRYEWDHTQGPACAIAAGAATIYRNYFAPVGNQRGQTEGCQINALSDFEEALAAKIGTDARSLWRMKNGYVLPSEDGLRLVNKWLADASADELDEMRSLLRIGLHLDVEVTEAPNEPRPLVSQAFCSAMPVSYSGLTTDVWAPLARLILEAAYEATLHAGVQNAARGASNRVLLTRLGGGAFGNPDPWIDDAIRRALRLFANTPLDVIFVSYRTPPTDLIELVNEFR